MARSRSIKSGCDVLAFRIASMPSNASRTTISLCRPWSKNRTDRRIEALSSAINTVFVTSGVDGYSASDAIQVLLYYALRGSRGVRRARANVLGLNDAKMLGFNSTQIASG